MRGLIAFAAAALISSAAAAQIIPPSEQPGRQRLEFAQPPVVLGKPTGATPTISLPSSVAPPGARSLKLVVKKVEITGSTVYSPAQLAPLYAGLIGHQVTLQSIFDLAQRITAKYGQDGYVLSRAVVPPQTLNPKGATVHIQIVEGWINKVEWPAAVSKYRDFFSDYTAKITGERPANIHTIERYVLLASDLPGLKFSTALKASPHTPDASTLVVSVVEKPFDTTVRLDNRGTKARGPLEGLVSTTFNNPLHIHDSWTLTYAGAASLNELQYFQGVYRQVLNSEGLTMFVDGSVNWGRPGTMELRTLRYANNGTLFEAGVTYPFVRSRERNFALTALAFASDDDADVLGSIYQHDRLRGLRVRADGNLIDGLGGTDVFYAILSQGIDGAGSTANGNPLASRLVGLVNFTKAEGFAEHVQPVWGPVSLKVMAYGQFAGSPLLSPEQCGFGGRVFGRAFDPSELTADDCLEASGEVRDELPTTGGLFDKAQAYAFSDFGDLHTLDAAFGTPAHEQAASAGLGLRLKENATYGIDLTAAKGIEGPRNGWRGFFAITAKF